MKKTILKTAAILVILLLLLPATTLAAEAGCGWVLLTTVTAADFYRRFGYEAQPMIRARNQEPVFARQLRKE